MFDRLDQMVQRYDDLGSQLADPTITGDPARYQKVARQHSELSDVVEKYREYRELRQGIGEAQQMKQEGDADLRAMAEEELLALEARLPQVEEDLKLMLLPKDPNDAKNVILEIRAGTGGDEASLFAAEMFRMYSRFAELHRWRVEVMSTSESGVGGMKEVIALIEGKGVFSQLKFEGGTHRVQRVPATETQGRVHTSAITVAVLPEAE